MAKTMKLSIIYDNRSAKSGMETGWGFSCLVETGEASVLFDAGNNGEKLLSNMRLMGKNPARITHLVLSHKHRDHTGGAGTLLKVNPKIRLYAPKSFPVSLKESLRKLSGGYQEVKEAVEVVPSIWSTGELGRFLKEQALILDRKQNLVLLTGCAHPGIVEVVRETRKLCGEKAIVLVGGVHFFEKFAFQIRRSVVKLKGLVVEKIAPCHCTGERGTRILSSAFGENFIRAGAGTVIEV